MSYLFNATTKKRRDPISRVTRVINTRD